MKGYNFVVTKEITKDSIVQLHSDVNIIFPSQQYLILYKPTFSSFHLNYSHKKRKVFPFIRTMLNSFYSLTFKTSKVPKRNDLS